MRDITIIGAGPVGLAAAFWAGMREASSQIIDSLPEIGGQLTTLYPEKWIFDVPGHPKILADRKSTRLNSSHANISYAVFCLKKKKKHKIQNITSDTNEYAH